jgi:PD-(D/E)XK nuclease superfamily
MVRADIHGINIPLFFGTGIHYALEQYYSPILRRDPIEAFRTWFDVQWRGGTVTKEWLPLVYDLKPKRVGSTNLQPGTLEVGDFYQLYQVRGLEDILPQPDHEEWESLRELGVNMLTYYKQYAEHNDDFAMIVAEHDFSIPIWDYENDQILRRIDVREESPNYGSTLEVHARGRMDGLWVRPNGKHGILENKTAQKWGEDELIKLESDEQTTHYLYAAEIEAKYYDLPHKGQPLEEVIYNVLRKAYPRQPTELSNGMFSTDRQNESTTYEMLMEWIRRNMPGVPLSEKQKAYVEYLREIGDENFIIRKYVRRNRHQLRNAGYRLYLETLDMLSSNLRIYPNISNSYKCLNCAFRPPCMAKEDGGDWAQLIRDNYVTAKDR